MKLLNDLNIKILSLKKEKADISSEIAEVQRKRSEKGANSSELDAERVELIADAADVDREISIANAQIKYLIAPMQEREKRTDSIRILVSALLQNKKPNSDIDDLIRTAITIEDRIQSAVPFPILPDQKDLDLIEY